jgi:hypothetical protein
VPLDELERTYLQRVLEITGGIIEGTGGAAEILQLRASTLRSRRKRLGFPRQSAKDHQLIVATHMTDYSACVIGNLKRTRNSLGHASHDWLTRYTNQHKTF